MLQEYHRAREEAKVEIAQARDRLKERTEQEKKRIRQQIISQLLKVGNETVLCPRTGLEPRPDLRHWQPLLCLCGLVGDMLESVGLCFQPKAGLTPSSEHCCPRPECGRKRLLCAARDVGKEP